MSRRSAQSFAITAVDVGTRIGAHARRETRHRVVTLATQGKATRPARLGGVPNAYPDLGTHLLLNRRRRRRRRRRHRRRRHRHRRRRRRRRRRPHCPRRRHRLAARVLELRQGCSRHKVR